MVLKVNGNSLKTSNDFARKEILNTNITDLHSILEKAYNIRDNCKDYILENKLVVLDYVENNIVTMLNEQDGSVTYKFSDYALSQLCTRLSIPSSYIKNSITRGGIYIANVNIQYWLSAISSSLLYRTYKNTVRGVLSNKYSILDSHEILEVLCDVFDESYKVAGYYLSEGRLHIRLVLDTPIIDDVYLGVVIDSSDVGRSSLKCRVMLYKQICTNGLMIDTNNAMLYQQKHIGISKERFKKELVQSLDRVKDFSYYVDVIRKAKQVSVKDLLYDSHGMSNMFKTKFKLSNSAIEDVMDILLSKYELNVWGVINAITEYAQSCTLERRIELEEISGKVLENVGGTKDEVNI